MRILNAVFCVVLILFAAVQYNDPDAPLWIVIYGVPALWCGLAAYDPARLASGRLVPGLLIATLALAVLGTFQYWPAGFAWWNGQVIWDTEVVREGLGMAIALAGMVVAALTAWVHRGHGQLASRSYG